MTPEERKRLEVRADVIKAMAHATRLYLVEQLAEGERCVCELNDGVDADVSTVSRHLGILKNAGIIESERRGQKVFYRLRTPCVLGFFGCIENVLEKSDDQDPGPGAGVREVREACGECETGGR